MKKIASLFVGLAMIASVSAHAADQKTQPKPIGELTCKDFLMLDAHFKPTAVAFAEGLTKKDKVVDPVLDVQGIENIVPIIVQECQDNKGNKFVNQVKKHSEKKEAATSTSSK